MLEKRKITHLLLAINLALILFISIRSGSGAVSGNDIKQSELTIEKLALVQATDWPGDTLILIDFEKNHDKNNMYYQGGEYQLSLQVEYATHGLMALVIQKEFMSNMELAVTHFHQDWRGYDSLFFDIYNDDSEAASFWLRVGDSFDATRFYVESQKYRKSFRLNPGHNRLAVSVDDVFEAFGYLPERLSLHLNFPAESGRRLILDYFRLVRYDSSIQ